MTRLPALLALPFALLLASPAAAQELARTETVVDVRVHGNHSTPDAEVLRLAQVAVGAVVTGDLAIDVSVRLRRSGRFRSVDVRKRYASIADPSAVLLVIVVEERAGVSADVAEPGPLRRMRAGAMWLPVLGYEDGYGFTYGVRVGFVDLLGRRSRLSVPLTWGGERRAAVELEQRFVRGPFTRVEVSAGTSRREHPALDVGDRRSEVAARAERALRPWLRVGGAGRLADVSFGDLDDQMGSLGVDVALDTRTDPAFPRNAIQASVAVDRLWFDTTSDTLRTRVAVRGYVGLIRQVVLVVGGQHQWSADALPVYEQPLLGGASSLRGFRTGFRSSDRLAAATAEVRVPLSSPLSRVRLGVAAFGDVGTVYPADQPLADARWDQGAGAGVFATAPLFSVRLDVAHGISAGTRVHVSLGVTF